MDRKNIAIFALCSIIASQSIAYGSEADFKINQLGYYPASTKYAIIKNTKVTTFDLISTTGTTVYTGSIKDSSGEWKGDTVRIADFSAFKTEGDYRIKVADQGESYPFKISQTALKNVSIASLKAFYFQRCSMTLLEKYAGVFAREAGHPDTACLYHVSTGDTTTNTLSSPKGWYDAGDYGKYVVNAGITVGTLLQFYENFPDYFADNTLNIPESGNGINDLLDEVKYELDWLKTMQDTDGKVFFKVTTLKFPGMVRPERDKAARYIVGFSTTSALNFAAVMAMAGRVYKTVDSQYALDCISRAKLAWNWTLTHPDTAFTNPSDVLTGQYGDTGFSDEKKWAAAELFITTNDTTFKNYVNAMPITYALVPAWQSVGSLAALSLSTVPNGLDSAKLSDVRATILSKATSLVNQINASYYRVPSLTFVWGSNSVVANIGIELIYAYLLSKDTKYLNAAAEVADYLLGKNAVSYSFVTGYGSNSPLYPHHRPSVGDTVTAPIPGFLVGGPNGTAQTYLDDQSDYTTNEIAINWNAPSTFLFAALDKILPTLPLSAKKNSISRTLRNASTPYLLNGKLHFSINDPLKSSMKLYNLKGRLIKDLTKSISQMHQGSAVINLQINNAQGIYVLKYFDGCREYSLATTKIK